MPVLYLIFRIMNKSLNHQQCKLVHVPKPSVGVKICRGQLKVNTSLHPHLLSLLFSLLKNKNNHAAAEGEREL